MRMAIRVIFFIIGVCLFTGNLQAQSMFLFRGKVLNPHDSSGVYNAHIYNIKNQSGAVTSLSGSFQLFVKQGDSVRISAIGFESLIIDSFSRDKRMNIYLTPKAYMIDSVTIYPFTGYLDFRQAVIDMKKPDDSIKIYLGKRPEEESGGLKYGNGVPIESPITALYEQFSKKGRERRAYHELLARDAFEARVNARYNEAVVKKVTGLKDKATIQAFMEYCNLSDYFVLETNEYYLYLAISNCYEKYRSVNSPENAGQ